MIIPIVAILAVFGMPVAIVGLVLYFHHRRNKLRHETVRLMIEKGIPLTPESVIESEARPHRSRNDLLSGLICIGVGLGLVIGDHRYIGWGGLIPLFIGVAFLIVWIVERNNKSNGPADK